MRGTVMNEQGDRPVYLSPVAEGIPEPLKVIPRWVLWKAEKRDGRWTKVPYKPNGDHAKSNDPTTWSTFEAVWDAYTGNVHFTGVGLVLNGDGLVGVDLDHAVEDDGMATPEAKRIVNTLGSYTEISPSGKGLRIFCKGTLPKVGRKKGPFEFYEIGRYLTVTGNYFGSPLPVMDCTKSLVEIHTEIFGDPSDKVILDKAFAAKNGAKVRSLYNGGWEGAYPSQSEADSAFCHHLAFYTKDSVQIDRIFRSSRLMRPKWGEVHYSGGSTYGEEVIRLALSRVTADYGGERRPEPDNPQSKERRFHFLPAYELCSEPKPTEWLIKSFIDSGALLDIFGPPAIMKSFLALDMGLHVATARDWHGFHVKQGGAVFFIAGEGFAGLNRRIKAWADHYEVDLMGVPFFVSDRPAAFLDEESVSEIVRAVDGLREVHGAPVLIIIDTLARNFGPGDENSTKDMGKFISAIDTALRSRYHCAIAIVHHTGLVEETRGRGSSALRAALDWEYSFSERADGMRIFSCTKAKDHAPPPVLSFKPEIVALPGWVDEDGQEETSCILHRIDDDITGAMTDTQKLVFKALASFGGPVDRQSWLSAVRSSGRMEELSTSKSRDTQRKAFGRIIEELRKRGYVATENDQWWTVEGQTKGQGCLDIPETSCEPLS
jgi:putative DNA primase/helicase